MKCHIRQRLLSDTQGEITEIQLICDIYLTGCREQLFLTCYVDNNSNGADRMPEPGVCVIHGNHET